MPRPNRTVLLALMLLSLALLSAKIAQAAVSSDEYVFKAYVESRIEERIFWSLSEIAGTDKIIVMANAEVETDIAKAKALQRPTASESVPTGPLLPGVPPQKQWGKTREVPTPPATLPPSTIRRLTVTVLVDSGVADSLLGVMRDVAISMSGYNPDRGDTINIKKIAFTDKTGSSWASAFYPPYIYWTVLVILGGLLMLTASSFLLNPFRQLTSALRSVNWDAIRGTTTVELKGGEEAAKEEAVLEAARAEQEKPKYFFFVTEAQVPDLAFLLSSRPALDAAVVVNYLPPELATRLLEHFSEEKQAEIALQLTGGNVIKGEKVHELEEAIKTRLDFVMGGEGRLAPILNLTSDGVRERFMEMLEAKDPDAADRLRKKIKGFDDIMRGISTYGIQALFRRLNPTAFAQVLQNAPGDIQERVLGALSEGAGARLKEEMELSRPMTEARLRRERNHIITLVRQMATAGLIEEVED